MGDYMTLYKRWFGILGILLLSAVIFAAKVPEVAQFDIINTQKKTLVGEDFTLAKQIKEIVSSLNLGQNRVYIKSQERAIAGGKC